MTTEGRAAVVGIGMVGGSIASALRLRGWEVFGYDIDESRMQEALDLNVIDHAGLETDVAITFIATPVSVIAAAAAKSLEGPGVVTDVGSVKGSVCDQIHHPRFIGGHPMAGSDVSGLAGVDPELFNGATWVLTPTDTTSPVAQTTVNSIVSSLGAQTIVLDPKQHDMMVATISHVPHIAASALMALAVDQSQNHDQVLNLAAGGFRDMTRIAGGHPQLWTDISLANSEAIVSELTSLSQRLADIATIIEKGDAEAVHDFLDKAARARHELPTRANRPTQLAVVSIPVPDRAGALADVLGVFGDERVNIEDLDIAHDTKGDRGVLQVTISQNSVDQIRQGLGSKGVRCSVENL